MELESPCPPWQGKYRPAGSAALAFLFGTPKIFHYNMFSAPKVLLVAGVLFLLVVLPLLTGLTILAIRSGYAVDTPDGISEGRWRAMIQHVRREWDLGEQSNRRTDSRMRRSLQPDSPQFGRVRLTGYPEVW